MFTVKGAPFFSLGGQMHNSTSYRKEDIAHAAKAVKAVNANTLAAPVMWQEIEPEEDRFDFTQLHNILDAARAEDLKVIVLWFGSWKNGFSYFIPEWVKKDKKRFLFVRNHEGREIMNLSAVSIANREADKKAFLELMKEIKRVDTENTVLAVQVQNEPGIIGSDRDYSREAQNLYEKGIPGELLAIMGVTGRLGMDMGWEELFKEAAGEYYTAYHTAGYINAIAKEGKEILDIPMYTNAWIRQMYWQIAGASYPSGGPVTELLQIWKALTPALDTLSPDIYVRNTNQYREVCEEYAFPRNVLYIPESSCDEAAALNMFYAFEKPTLAGFHSFAIDSLLRKDGTFNTPYFEEYIESMKIASGFVPLLEHRQGTIYAVVQEEFTSHKVYDFGDYIGMVRFYGKDTSHMAFDNGVEWLDTHHCIADPEAVSGLRVRGRGLINYRGKGEFLLAGCGFRLLLAARKDMCGSMSGLSVNEWMMTRLSGYMSVEEGEYDGNMVFQARRKRGGDETDNGIWVTSDIGLVRVRMEG